MTLDKIVWYVHALLENDHCLTITDMQQEMAAYFSHKVSGATIVHALQWLKMQKVYSQKNIEKNHTRGALNFLTQYEEDGNNLLERIITSEENWIHFY